MASPQDFIQRAMMAGYTKDAISRFLREVEPTNRQKMAVSVLDQFPDRMDPEQQIIAQRDESEPLGDMVGRGAATAARVGIPAALTYAAAGPIAGAIAGEAAGAAGLAGEAASGAEALGGIRQAVSRAAPLSNIAQMLSAYQRRGVGGAMEQLLQTMGREQPTEAAPETMGLPQELARAAEQAFERTQDASQAAALASFQILESARHPLKNLARTFEARTGIPLHSAFEQYLSGAVGGAQMGAPAEDPQDLAALSDSDLMNLMRQRGLL